MRTIFLLIFVCVLIYVAAMALSAGDSLHSLLP